MNIKELNRMESELRQLKELADETQIKMGALQRQHNQIKSKIDSLTSRIERFRKEEKIIKVSDHAIVRYMERVAGIDTEYIKQKLITDDIRDIAVDIEDGAHITHKDGFRLVVRDGVVVTILTNDSDKKGW